MEYKMMGVADLIPYVSNARTHSDEQVTQIAASIREFGFINPIIIDGERSIIAGHGRLMAAKKLGLDQVPTLEVTHLSEAQRKAYVLADNQLALNAGWDDELLQVELQDLKTKGFDIDLIGFEKDFVDKLLAEPADTEDENNYTKKVETPIYEPSDQCPELNELVDTTKTEELHRNIDQSSLPSEVKEFLKVAAYRHAVFNYAKIADYYAHGGKELARLMEDSFLVIIDFQQAIEKGFVKLAKDVAEQYKAENVI